MSRIFSHLINSLSNQTHWSVIQLMRLIILITLITGSQAFAIGADYKLKAAYIYQFTKFTHWSADAFEGDDSPIRICVLGRNPFGNSLDGFTSRKSQDRYLSVEYLSSLKNITHCQLVFISKSEEKRLPQILRRISRLPVLSVSDMDGFTRRGGIIGFVPRKRKVGIEINVGASRKAKVMLSSKLLEVSTVVESDLVEVSP